MAVTELPPRDGSREQEIIEEYEDWDPDTESVNHLVDRIGISRQRLYQVLDKHDVIPKSKRAGAMGAVERTITIPAGAAVTLRIIVEVSDSGGVSGL